MSSPAPDWDLLVGADEEDLADHLWFPAGRARTVNELPALEGMRFRNAYLTDKAIEHGSAGLFAHLYRTAKLMGGAVLHVGDFREYP